MWVLSSLIPQVSFYALSGTISLSFFKQNPFRSTYFLPTAAKSKQKMPLSKQCFSSTKSRVGQNTKSIGDAD
jgi:hypothetical protein